MSTKDDKLKARAANPSIHFVRGIPLVLKHSIDDLPQATWNAVDRLKAVVRAALDRGRKAEAHRLILQAEKRMGITSEDRIVAANRTDGDLDTLIEQAVRAATRSARPVTIRRQPAKATVRPRKKATPVFSDVPTPERARRSNLVAEPNTIVAAAEPAPNRQWDQDALPAPRKIITGYTLKDCDAETRTRLSKLKRLSSHQVEAGVRLADDWEASGLEPRMTANLFRAGGGGMAAPSAGDGWGGKLTDRVIKARNNLHAAVQALRLGGDEVVRIVEAVVLKGQPSGLVGSAQYADAARANAHVAGYLDVGLNILVLHYKLSRAATTDTTSANGRISDHTS